jgi:hypothetical protein
MNGLRTVLVLICAAACLLVSARLTLHAQESGASPRDRPRPSTESASSPASTSTSISVQDALQKPFPLPFAEPTSLADVRRHLSEALRAPVVLDLAALERLGLTPEAPVQLELEGVRLKTGLKLLLDQVELTFHVIPEDNLLVLTDSQGSSEPIDRVLSEIKALHRDVHDLQDAVEDILWALGLDEEEEGAKMRKPTIIEEVPAEAKPGEKPHPPPSGTTDRPAKRSRPGV